MAVGSLATNRRCHALAALVAALLLFGTRSLAQQEALEEPAGDAKALGRAGWTFHMDNDVLYSRYNDDRNYTGGFGFELAWSDRDPKRIPGLTRPVRALDRWIARRRLAPSTDGGRKFYGALFATTAFTPESLSTREPIFDDRPYCSLFFASTKVLSVNPAEDFARTTELGLGVVGLPIAGEVQAFIHEYITGSADPLGWDNQISDGGEPTAFVRLAGNKRLLSRPSVGSPRIQLAYQVETALGYQTYAALGSTLRVGKIDSPFWGFDPNPLGVGTRKAPSEPPVMQRRRDGRSARALQELYLFAAVRGSGVVYNVALQGQFRDSRVTFGGSEIERFLYELHGGVTVRLWRTTITYALHLRAPEFKGAGRRHVWGGLYVSRSLS